MPVRRGYRQACGIARSLDLVGERWALLIVRELLLGPKRFTDLRAGLPGASPNAVTDRLNELTDSGVIRRRQLPPPAGSWVYELTEWGRQLEPIVLALGTWARHAAARREQDFVSLDSLMLAIRSYYTPSPQPSQPAESIMVRIPSDGDGAGRTFGIWLEADSARVSHEVPDRPDAVLTTDIPTLLAALGRPDWQTRLPKRRMTVTGDRAAVHRLVVGVVVPQPASTPQPTSSSARRPAVTRQRREAAGAAG